MNLPPELVKFLAKIKSLEPMLGKDDSPLSDSDLQSGYRPRRLAPC